VNAEKVLACFRGQQIEAHNSRLVEALKSGKPDAIRDREQITKEDPVRRLLKDLNAIDTPQSISGLIRDNIQTLKPLY
jgi:hypothetical protein